MARRSKPDPSGLETRLGHSFRDPLLLERALTHVSAAAGEAGQSNQRLEFLGDRVLGLAVAEMLYATFPAAAEGELSRRLSDLVRRETCFDLAERWELGAFLRLGSGEGKAGGRRNPATLADATEAVLGAVFLDGGYEAARGVVERALGEQIRARTTPPRDPKTALQEWAQARGKATPTYAVVERSGPDHAPHFSVVARIKGVEEAVGNGKSKREAEQKAALAMLTREGVWTSEDAA
ncbi:ribonuclease III [Enterovirga aerilata]|uniref:Ribonuclease 3 n=1 Tax=Enterovirga aerilata TaxID=2730920 RepID=A0A849HYP7_9HYPH|nr:ribonuclease III [Enterovirga sp. DB1703]NNM72232.1 ribonuclease III [Enterovirga sp. DB1703]